MQSIRESSEEELLEFKEVSGENIEMLIESEEFYRNQDPMINLFKKEWLSLVKNTDNLSKEERINRLKELVKPPQTYNPEIDRILKKIETEALHRKVKNAYKPPSKHFLIHIKRILWKKQIK